MIVICFYLNRKYLPFLLHNFQEYCQASVAHPFLKIYLAAYKPFLLSLHSSIQSNSVFQNRTIHRHLILLYYKTRKNRPKIYPLLRVEYLQLSLKYNHLINSIADDHSLT